MAVPTNMSLVLSFIGPRGWSLGYEVLRAEPSVNQWGVAVQTNCQVISMAPPGPPVVWSWPVAWRRKDGGTADVSRHTLGSESGRGWRGSCSSGIGRVPRLSDVCLGRGACVAPCARGVGSSSESYSRRSFFVRCWLSGFGVRGFSVSPLGLASRGFLAVPLVGFVLGRLSLGSGKVCWNVILLE